MKLAIVITHPIQYYAPLFSAMSSAGRVDLRVFYTFSQSASGVTHDSGFGRSVGWDIPLLAGYEYEFVPNVSSNPNTELFGGIRNPELSSRLQKWGADRIFYGWNHFSHLQAMRYFHGRKPVLFRGDSTLLDPMPWPRKLMRRGLLRWVYQNIDCAVAVGTNNAEYFRWCGVPNDRIAFAPHSVDVPRFAADSPELTERALTIRRQAGVPDHALTFLFAGKFQSKKNPLALISALGAVGDGAHLLLVGDGTLEAQMKERARDRGNIHFLPFQNQAVMPAVYRAGDVFVLPSIGPGETWGLALNEAMASGRPVIASDRCGGAEDLVADCHTGWIFRADDPSQLADVLKRAFEQGVEGLERMGVFARAHSKRFSTDVSAVKLIEAAEQAVVR